VLHLHFFSGRCGLSHARIARAAGVRVVVTVHAPGFSCIKGNLIDASGAVCDGRLRQRRCTRCRLQNGGLPRWLAGGVALQSGWPLSSEAGGRLAHILTARQLTGAFHAAWLELTRLADAIHVLAGWSREVLLGQGVPAQKIHLIRSAGPEPLAPRRRQPMDDGVLRLVAWGRCHPVKGFHLLVPPIQALPADLLVLLHVYGPGWDEAYGQQLRRRMGNDPRFAVLGTLPPEQLLPRLQQYDLAAVPSTWLETGPLTVLEALAAHLPVAGTDRGGIHELAGRRARLHPAAPPPPGLDQLFTKCAPESTSAQGPAGPAPRSPFQPACSRAQPPLRLAPMTPQPCAAPCVAIAGSRSVPAPARRICSSPAGSTAMATAPVAE